VFAQQLNRLPGRLVDEVGDVRDHASVEWLMREHGVTQVVHMAAITASAERERRSGRRGAVGHLAGLARVMTAAANAGVKRFVYLGSIAVSATNPPTAA